jgi:hypothetical protein
MIELFRPVSLACLVEVPAEQRRPIAVVGAGAIVDLAHLLPTAGAAFRSERKSSSSSRPRPRVRQRGRRRLATRSSSSATRSSGRWSRPALA